MGLINTRMQHAVGQGFFHTAELHEEGTLRLRYVYDCGAMTKYQVARSNRIKGYLKSVGAHATLDLLFISHVHADHLNGLTQLLDSKKGVAVDTIVLPFFNVADRLIAYARDAIEDPATLVDNFYREFVIDPTTALSGFGPRQILFMVPGGPDSPGAPDLDGGRPEGPDGHDMQGLRDEKGQVTWKPLGRGWINSPNDRTHAESALPRPIVATLPDSVGLVSPSIDPNLGLWLLSPFVDPAVDAQQAVFFRALLKALNHGVSAKAKMKAAALKSWLAVPTNLRDLVTNRTGDLTQAYSAVSKNLNITSMCLYSGPLPDGVTRPEGHHGVFGTWNAQGKGGIAWLGTGDAALKEKARRRSFLKHYRKLLGEVVTLTIPHHGSEGNFDAELLTKVDPSFCIVAADAIGTWRHPDTAVVQTVASHGLFLSVVTSDTKSCVYEQVVIG